jgi:hypothetical protein
MKIKKSISFLLLNEKIRERKKVAFYPQVIYQNEAFFHADQFFAPTASRDY